MQNPLKQTAVIRHAAAAICIGLAQRNDMPHAAAGLQEVQLHLSRADDYGHLSS